MDFDDRIARAWQAHSSDPAGVAAGLLEAGTADAVDARRIGALARLGHHVLGEHLGRWAEGHAWIERLLALPACDAATAAALRGLGASLLLARGSGDPRPTLAPGERVRVAALAAAALAPHDAPRALALLQDALAEAPTLADSDPAQRAVAVAANNLACTLEDRRPRSAAERELMLAAAQAARRHWALAGGWLEVERAEYRLASIWLAAGDAVAALRHAERCLQTVVDHEGPAFERFHAWIIVGRAAHAAGRGERHGQARTGARLAWEALSADDRAGTRAELDSLDALDAPGA
ncbi:MAG: hypothetical protein KGN16_14260 [Burkholderiales bacterium]|nr:hypothetical protein [Burkholderiales bacterium]